MASYESWNHAIISYVMAGEARGAAIYLSIDEESVEEIAARFLEDAVQGDPVRDLRYAVREKVVNLYRDTIVFNSIRPQDGGVPSGVAFLAIMVMAAYKMHEEEQIDESNYFLRLREALELHRVKGRPEGMSPGSEEFLWLAWNRHLASEGFRETAERGTGPQTFIRYPLSQAILRETDKHFLRHKFKDADLPRQFDCDQLGFWLSRQALSRRHLTEGLNHADSSRKWEFYKAVYRVYEGGDWAFASEQNERFSREARRSIECGLYRVEDLVGKCDYLLFPKQPARTRSTELRVDQGESGKWTTLRPLRSGFFRPLWSINPFVEEAKEYMVQGDVFVQKLLFPRRDFWILTCDPENTLGTWANWKPYLELGEQLLVLCRQGLFADEMERFKEAGLLDWSRKQTVGNWIEYYGCMVLSFEWGSFISTTECRSLANSLAPRSIAGIALHSGLRNPYQNSWLFGHPPVMKVYGFERHFDLIVSSTQGREVFNDQVARQSEVVLPSDLEPGTYHVEVRCAGRRAATRIFVISPWTAIQEHPRPEQLRNSNPASTAGLVLRGPFTEEISPAEGDRTG